MDIDIFVVGVAVFIMLFVARIFRDANGHSPFLAGYFGTSLVLTGGAVAAMTEAPLWILQALRVGLALTLLGTLVWAGKK